MTLGTLSGRDGDKIARTSLTPLEVEGDMTFQQADTTLVCRKIYTQALDPAAIPDWAMRAHYVDMQTHTLFVGQIISALTCDR